MRLPIVMVTIFSMTVLPTVPSAFAGPAPVESKVHLQNVELSTAGIVDGHIVDDKGAPLSNTKVQIRTKDGAQEVTTDVKGRFRLESKVGGNCAVVVGDKAYACRLWSNGTAPPKSLTKFGIVHTDGPIVRGQYDECVEGCDDNGYGRLGGVTNGQLLGLGLLAGAVVAIVLAVEYNDGS
ncbi:MAG: carboxypeptidase-like regulatory domain-containing protein [Fuerstiella sp.]|nr:carboxypeptidase-like regulatory domain-containing protein [Fuerstiella sp.]